MFDRYAWRHNNILYHLVKSLASQEVTIYSDLENSGIAGGTVPPDIMPTELKPDIVIIWKDTKQVAIIELTVPFESNIDNANKRKTEKYSCLDDYIKSAGYKVYFWVLEVGSRGYISKVNMASLKNTTKLLKSSEQGSKLSVSLS